MLKALANGWEVFKFRKTWIWTCHREFAKFEIPATQSDIPEINDELREEFKKI